MSSSNQKLESEKVFEFNWLTTTYVVFVFDGRCSIVHTQICIDKALLVESKQKLFYRLTQVKHVSAGSIGALC